ncbi:hypothetical protein [Flavobacterium sp.]|uniref:hypothetical protein n=1 Tax=Flavobacterium sp. TaxID=239 RepID=UPI002B6D23C1|nr:hypothetical protein [Flavobacterium sp.]HSD07919.1 hypothetical protein [Flavobacterium sp.]
MKKQMKGSPPLSDETKKMIVDRWRYYPMNTISQLAQEFNCSEGKIHTCINNYLATKSLH